MQPALQPWGADSASDGCRFVGSQGYYSDQYALDDNWSWRSRDGIPWEYEPHTFLLETDEQGRVVEAVTPDFFLPTIGAYVECTTTKPALIARKRRKARKLQDKYGAIVTLLERDDLERLLCKRRRWWPASWRRSVMTRR